MKILFFLFAILIFTLSGCSSNENVANNTSYNAEKQLAYTSNNTNSSTYNGSDNVSYMLNSFSTTIYTKTEERQTNVELCCNKLNGHIVSSGETFSFCDTLRSCNS